jgi:hypothetical protein
MSGLGGEHVREMPLESDLGAGYVWLTREMPLESRPDMSGQSIWNLARGPDISGDKNRTVRFAKPDTPILT